MIHLHHQSWGQGDPMIILHGLFGSGDNWASVGTALSKRFRVFALDQRNHGSSPHVPEMNYAWLAQDVVDFMDQQMLTKTHLLGHSMGGKVAMMVAFRHPERVDRLVVVDIAPRPYPPWHEEILRAMSNLQLNQYTSRAELDSALAPSIQDRTVRQFLLKSVRRDGGHFAWKLNLSGLTHNYPQLNEGLPAKSRFEGPALFVAGECSDYITATDRSQILTQFPSAQFCTVPGAGHWVHAESPKAFLECLWEFYEPRADPEK